MCAKVIMKSKVIRVHAIFRSHGFG